MSKMVFTDDISQFIRMNCDLCRIGRGLPSMSENGPMVMCNKAPTIDYDGKVWVIDWCPCFERVME